MLCNIVPIKLFFCRKYPGVKRQKEEDMETKVLFPTGWACRESRQRFLARGLALPH